MADDHIRDAVNSLLRAANIEQYHAGAEATPPRLAKLLQAIDSATQALGWPSAKQKEE